MRILTSIAAVTMLAGCVTDEQQSVEAPAPVATATPMPSPTSTPSPTPSPSPGPTLLNDGKTIVVLEGDSITSPRSEGVYSGYFISQNPQYEFYNLAVGGSGLNDVQRRQAEAIALKPDVLTLFIGANDFGGDAAAYAQRVFDYIAPFKANGTRVCIGTVLPKTEGGVVIIGSATNVARIKYAEIMQAEVGKKIDCIFDFARHPVMGPDSAAGDRSLYSDGLHPTWRNGATSGHDYMYETYSKAVSNIIKEAAQQYD